MSRPNSSGRTTAQDDAAIVGLVIVCAVFAWLLWPRESYDDIAPRRVDTSYDSRPAGPESSYVWPLVERTITTVVVVHPEDMP